MKWKEYLLEEPHPFWVWLSELIFCISHMVIAIALPCIMSLLIDRVDVRLYDSGLSKYVVVPLLNLYSFVILGFLVYLFAVYVYWILHRGKD